MTTELYEYLGLTDAEPVEISDVFNAPTNIDPRVPERLHTDMAAVGCSPPRARAEPDGTKTWPWFCGMRIKRMGVYDDPFDFPLQNMTSNKEIDGYPWPDLSTNIMKGVPVQPPAKNMDPWRLKMEFGKDIAFPGGFDIRRLMSRGTVEEIRKGAKKLIGDYGRYPIEEPSAERYVDFIRSLDRKEIGPHVSR